MNKQDALPKIVTQCVELLTVYPKTEHEISLKIDTYLSKAYYQDLTDSDKDYIKQESLRKLKIADLINDDTYIAKYVESNTRSIKPDGPLLLYKKLRQKGVSSETLAQNAKKIAENEFDNAQRLLVKKFGNSDVSDQIPNSERQKKLAYLATRGFRYSTLTQQ